MLYRDITGLVLAGGRAQRMGGVDKGLLDLGGKPMIAHIVERLRPQVRTIIINANRNQNEYKRWSDTVIKDSIGEFDGPLAGVASGLEVADTNLILTVPCDSPLIAENLASRMHSQLVLDNADIAVASDGDRLQPVFMLLQRSLLSSIVEFLQAGERKIDKWFAQHGVTEVDFSDRPETFLNVNTPEEKDEFVVKYQLNV